MAHCKKYCWHFYYILKCLQLCILFPAVTGLEDYELDLYDLVEEVNGTFYDFMGLNQVR